MLIQNGLVFLPEEGGFVQKDVLVKDGKVAAVGENLQAGGEEALSAAGKYILPGLIEAHSHIGIYEDAIRWEGDDINEMTDPVMPELRALDAINPRDEAFYKALSGGVTVACTGPGSGGVVNGQSAVIRMVGGVVDDMALIPFNAMKCALGENPKDCYGNKDKMPKTRMAVAMLLRKALFDAKAYMARKERAAEKGEGFELDMKHEAMIPVLNKEMPLKVHCHRADDICTAIRIAREFGVDMTLDHCTDGHLIVDYLKQFNYPALVGPSFGTRTKIELKDMTFETPGILARAGIKVCIITDHNVLPQESLVMCAALAVKAGMSELDAFKAITVNPAEVLGIADRKGRLAPGLDADLSVWDRHPFDIMAVTEKVFLEGKLVYGV